jgi:NAD(P)-dependent dehydrogenase (short-subunit alcohol dehydrogenase family)
LILQNLFSLNNKVIIVTGASSGIGRACCIAFAKAGASLILIARNKERLIETASCFPESTRYSLISADLSSPELPETELKQAVDYLGKVNGLVYAAGISTTQPLRLADAQKLDNFYRSNVSGAVLLTKWLSKPSNFSNIGCSVVWLASVMGMVGESGKILYSLTKGALIAGAKSLALELAAKKIRVNTISPGVVETPMTVHAVYNQSEEGQERIKALHPLGLGKPDDIANAAIFLLSDASGWVTGINLTVDGGYTAR